VARQFLVHRVRGRFTDFHATVTVDADGGITVAGEAATASIDTGDPARDRHLRSPDFFDVERWPTMRLVGRAVGAGPHVGTYTVDAELTIRDVTRPVRFDAHLRARQPTAADDPAGPVGPAPADEPDRPTGSTPVVAAGVRASVDRTAFGLTWTPTIETGGVIVADRVELVMDLVARLVDG